MTLAAPARVRVPMVRPPRAMVVAGVVDLYAHPDATSERVDQAHYGEHVTVLGERGEWRYVQGEDHYFGWIVGAHLFARLGITHRPIVAVPFADVRAEPDPRAEVVDRLPAGSALLAGQDERPGDWLRTIGHGTSDVRWVARADTVEPGELPQRPPTPADLIATAESYLGVPYLWGGTSAHGIDCSGLTQQVYRLNGVGLDRDADQQALEGRPVDTPAEGDLIFFGEHGSVTHVAIALNDHEYIHAPLRDAVVERHALASDRTVLAIRRFLPDAGA